MLVDLDTAASDLSTRDSVAFARHVRTLAVRALWHELVTYPKPGLVSLVDNGSHADMTAATFARSALSLRRYFEHAALAGMADAPFAALRGLAIEAERRMLRATGGVNTHRGAIFNLGLLAAAAGKRFAAGRSVTHGTLGNVVRESWGLALATHRRDPSSHGSRVDASHHTGGALAEAMAGFPSVFKLALPAYRAVIARGGSANQARVQAFFELLAALADTNLLHRGGADGLTHARARAAAFIARGGVDAPDWIAHARAIHRDFCDRRLSPGGSADLLAACIFVHALED